MESEGGATPAFIVTCSLVVAVWAVGAVESFTVMATVAVPAAVGVPEIVPVELPIDNPLGSPLAPNLYGVVPPVAATLLLYAEPTVPLDSEVVVIES
jgi:hypothetical protein